MLIASIIEVWNATLPTNLLQEARRAKLKPQIRMRKKSLVIVVLALSLLK